MWHFIEFPIDNILICWPYMATIEKAWGYSTAYLYVEHF